MYYLLSLGAGVLISVMVAFNGGLSDAYGVYSSVLIVHVIGLLIMGAVTVIRRERPLGTRQRWTLYCGGLIGVLTLVFNNLAFGRISVSAILALSLLGQSVSGLVVDQIGWMNMPKYPFQKRKLAGLVLILCGILSMLDRLNGPAVILSLLSGVTIVTSRTINAALAEKTSETVSTLFNYAAGLLCAIPLFLLLGRGEPMLTGAAFSPQIHIYLGGLLGVCAVFLSNVVVARISAFYCTLFMFVGQVYSGILVDAVIDQALSARNLIGGVFVTIGLVINLLIDRHSAPAKTDE